MQVYQKILNLLTEHRVNYTVRHHEPTPTSQDSARVRGESLSSGAKAIVYKVQDHYLLFVMAADQKLDPKKIKDYIKNQGKRVRKTRFASVEELENLTGLQPGSVPPFGRPILDLDLYVDPSLLENEYISFNAGSLQNSVTMRCSDYIDVAVPGIFDFTV